MESMHTEGSNESPSQRPANKLRYGNVEAAIWKNTQNTEDGVGNEFFSVTLARKFRHEDEWKETKSFDERDLPTVAKIASDAHSWIQSAKLPKA